MSVAWDEAAVKEEAARQKGEGAKASHFYIIKIDQAIPTAQFGPKHAAGGCIKAGNINGGAEIGGWQLTDSKYNIVYMGEVAMFQNAVVMWIGEY